MLKDFGFFWRIFWRLYFFMVKYLSCHNSSFAIIYLKKRVNGKVTLWHTPCCISLEVVLDIESFQIGCCSTAWLHASQSSPSKPGHTWQTHRAQYFTIVANRHSWPAELLRIWCHGPKGQRGQVPFRENSGTHGNNVYLSSESSSHHIGKLGMVTESLLVMINLYYCTLSKHVIEPTRYFLTNKHIASFLQQELKTYGSQERVNCL
jgi:hypothetical protein